MKSREPVASEADVFTFEEKSFRKHAAAFEKQFIMKMLCENGGNISKTAQTIGVERSHLHKKMKSYGIDISDLSTGETTYEL